MASDTQEKTSSGKAWAMLVIVYLLSVAVPILWFSIPPMLSDNTILAVFLGGDFTKVAAVGNTMSILSFGALAGAVVCTPLVKKFSVKTILVVGGFLAGIGGLLSAISAGDGAVGAGNFNFLLAGRFIIGIGVGLVGVTSPTAISTWFTEKNRGLAIGIWATWVPLGIILSTNLIVNPVKNIFPGAAGMGEHGPFAYSLPQIDWWIMTVLIFVLTLVVLFAYKAPSINTGVSGETKKIREILPFFKQYQIVALAVVWLAFNYVNYCFTTYSPIYFAGGFAAIMDNTSWYTNPAFWASISSALGILAPIPSAISDKLNRNRKWILIALGVLVLALTAVFGFRSQMGPISGWAMFYLYLACNAIGNAILVGTIRPYVPLLVGRGGATAVTLGLSMVTFLQFLGQTVMSTAFGGAVAANGGQLIASASQLKQMPPEIAQKSLDAWGIGCLEAVLPVAVVALVCAFFLKPSAPKAAPEPAKQD
jgi:MFS family permease